MAFMSTQIEHAHLDAILGPDQSHFETLITHLMSPSNEQRSNAESIFNFIKQNDPNRLILKLLNLISLNPRVESRAMSFILLRKCLTQGNSFLWPKLNYSTQACTKGLLLICIEREEPKPIVKKLCDTVSELASALIPVDGWPELLPFMLKCVTSDSVKSQELAFLILSQLAENIGEVLIWFVNVLHSVFLRTLRNSPNLDVRIAALSAVVSFVECLSSQGDREKLRDLLPLIMKLLVEALNSGQEAKAREVLELLIELAESNPRFFEKEIEDVLDTILQVAEADSLEEGTRHLAIEFVITLAEGEETTPGMKKKFSPFISRLFGFLLKMLLDINDDVVWHSAEVKHEAAGETNNYSVGWECLNRLSIALGGNTIVPVASEKIDAYFADPGWQKRHAALIAIGQIAEGCAKEMVNILEKLVNMNVIAFQDPNPRVRWASVDAFAHFSTAHGPDFQVQYHSQVLPVLTAAMDDFQNPRIQAHAALAIRNFCEICIPEVLLPHLGTIVSKLLVLVQNVKQMVQQGALVALGYVANLTKEHFQEYYERVMPSLKTILVNANAKSNRMVRAKAIDCISLVVMAVGKDKFKDDTKQVMGMLTSIQMSQMETDDPTACSMLQAWGRLCHCLGQDFLPYLNVVMPPLLRSAQLKPDVCISSADSEFEDDRMATITVGDQRFGIKTSVLEEKATACKMLFHYVDELKEGFYPWIDQVMPTLVPLLKLFYPEEFRRAAISVLPELLNSAKLAVEKGIAQGRDETYVKELLDRIIPTLVETLHKETDTEMCMRTLNAVNMCLKISGPLLDKGHIRSIVDEIKLVLTYILRRKQNRAEGENAEDFDSEDSDLINEEIDQEEYIFHYIGEILGELIQTFKASFLPFFDELSSYMLPMWGKDHTDEERIMAICVFGDVAEHCREAALTYYGTYVPLILVAVNDESSDVRQSAVYGLGICAKHGGSVFKPFIGEALSRLDAAIRRPNALQPENVVAYDNAVSALGKICQFHRDSIDSAQVVPAWLNCLPITADKMEAKAVHDQLCSMVERSDGELLGPNYQYLPRIVLVFAEVLCAGMDLASEQTRSRMINLLRQLQQTLPPAALASMWSSLKPQQKIALLSILSSKTCGN